MQLQTSPSTPAPAALLGRALTPSPSTRSATPPRGTLSFRLGAEAYAIDILKVQEIRSYSEPTRMAGAPSFVRGVIDLRGVIVPVIDLRLRFGLPDARTDGSTVVIVLNLAQRVVGIVVDAVNEVVDLRPEQLRAAPGFAGGLDTDFIDGLASVPTEAGERLLIVVDIERLVGSPSLGLAAV